jgi:hypothetical protein
MPLGEVLAAGQCIEHLHGYGTARRAGASYQELAEATAKAKVVNCPTIDFYAAYFLVDGSKALLGREELALVPPAQRKVWEEWLRGREIPAEQRRLGVERYRERLALTAALDHAGAPCDKMLGRIVPGNRADGVVLEMDPRRELQTLQRPLGVLLAGRWLSRDALQAKVVELATPVADA